MSQELSRVVEVLLLVYYSEHKTKAYLMFELENNVIQQACLLTLHTLDFGGITNLDLDYG